MRRLIHIHNPSQKMRFMKRYSDASKVKSFPRPRYHQRCPVRRSFERSRGRKGPQTEYPRLVRPKRSKHQSMRTLDVRQKSVKGKATEISPVMQRRAMPLCPSTLNSKGNFAMLCVLKHSCFVSFIVRRSGCLVLVALATSAVFGALVLPCIKASREVNFSPTRRQNVCIVGSEYSDSG